MKKRWRQMRVRQWRSTLTPPGPGNGADAQWLMAMGLPARAVIPARNCRPPETLERAWLHFAVAIEQNMQVFQPSGPLGRWRKRRSSGSTRERRQSRPGRNRDQDQPIQPLHLLKQLFDAGQQLRQRKRQTDSYLAFSSSATGASQATQQKIHVLSSRAPICPAITGR